MRGTFLVTVACLCGGGKQLHVPEWGQEGVFVVVATPRYPRPSLSKWQISQKRRDILRPVGLVEPNGPSLVPTAVN